MHGKAAITVNGPPDEIRRLWQSSEYRPQYTDGSDAAVTFTAAPGDRGTEIHVDLNHAAPGGKLGALVQKVSRAEPLAKVKDDLRRFKAHVETGEIPRSDAQPTGENVETQPKGRPAQPMDASELDKVSAR